jgi:DNA polymerase-3 subunit epsilon
MGYIVIDTEGTGLFQMKNPDGTTKSSDDPGQPRMAEFAAVFTDDDFNITGEYQSYIAPVGWDHEMPDEAYNVHGLSMDFLRENGKPVELALNVYTNAVETERRILLGFNQQHDGRQVRAELRRAGMNDLFEQTPNICAMRSITTNMKGQVKKLNGKGGFPRLIDAAAHFGIPYPEDKRHTALEDARVTVAVARELHLRKLLLPAEVHYARNHPSRSEAQ